MRAILYIVEEITGAKLPSSLIKSVIQRNNKNNRNRGISGLLRTIFQCVKLLFYPIFFAVRAKKINTAILVFESSESAKNIRIKHVRQYLNNYNSEILIVSKKNQYYEEINLKNILKALGIWLQFVKTIPIILIESNRLIVDFNYCEILNFNFTHCFTRSSHYFFYLIFRLDFYIAAYLLSSKKHLNSSYSFSSGDSYLYFYLRNTYLPDYSIKICNRILKSEFEAYRKKNWIVVKDAEEWGPEINITLDKSIIPKYDIGLYSSGSWARKNGLYRSNDIYQIKSLGLSNNINYKLFSETLKALITYTKNNGLKLIVYTHPFERKLFKNNNILPPYTAMLKKENIYLDINVFDNSLEKIPEVQIGVCLLSTIGLERLHYGYETLLNPSAYGKIAKHYEIYRDSFFSNIFELLLKLENVNFGSNSVQSD